MILFHTNVKYDNIFKKFEFERSRTRVKVTVAFFRNALCHHSIAFINESILILYHTNVEYDSILDKFEFERSKAKVKVTAAIFRKTLSSLYCPHLLSNFNITSDKYWV